MPSAQYTEVYQKVSKMGEKLKAAGKQGPSNDEQLSVRSSNLPGSRVERILV
jgi:diazepam-binding inhibitor (GABA receptor modulating acyl-CoA-binding protein)